MPYYIYRIKPLSIVEQLAQHASFGAASAQAKVWRGALPSDSADRIKVIFADNALQAEDLLCQVRDPQPPGEE